MYTSVPGGTNPQAAPQRARRNKKTRGEDIIHRQRSSAAATAARDRQHKERERATKEKLLLGYTTLSQNKIRTPHYHPKKNEHDNQKREKAE
jgi:hypothetical protein